ncbi:hypothetical protein VNI00_006897 [Paramarasmius palmivorus]|uniref:Uncharacterized protein n=1 Tax=Paramarasmius palmivorus TaxID=297713 RepID=A0AAW0D9U1_9AGAR
MTGHLNPPSQLPQPSVSLRPRASTRSSPALRSPKFAFQPSSPPSRSPPSVSPVPERRPIHDGAGPTVASQPRKLKKSPSRSGSINASKEKGQKSSGCNSSSSDRTSKSASVAAAVEEADRRLGDNGLGAKASWDTTPKQEPSSVRNRAFTGVGVGARRLTVAAPTRVASAIGNSLVSAATVSDDKGTIAVPDRKAEQATPAPSNSNTQSSASRMSFLPPPRVRAVTLGGTATVGARTTSTSTPIKSTVTPTKPISSRLLPASASPVTPRTVPSPKSSLKSRSTPSSPPPPPSTASSPPAVPPKSRLRRVTSTTPITSTLSPSLSSPPQTTTLSVHRTPSTSKLARRPSTNQSLPRPRYNSTPGPGSGPLLIPRSSSPSSLVTSPKLKPLLLSPYARLESRGIEVFVDEREMGTALETDKGKNDVLDTPGEVVKTSALATSQIDTPTRERQLKNRASSTGSSIPSSRKTSMTDSSRMPTRSSTATTSTMSPPSSLRATSRSSMAVPTTHTPNTSPNSSRPSTSTSNSHSSPRRTSTTAKPTAASTRTSATRISSRPSTSTSTSTLKIATRPTSPPNSSPASSSQQTDHSPQPSVTTSHSIEAVTGLQSQQSLNSGNTVIGPIPSSRPTFSPVVPRPRAVSSSSVKGPREPKITSRRNIVGVTTPDHSPTSPSSLRYSPDVISHTAPATELPQMSSSSDVLPPSRLETSNSFSSIISVYSSLPSASSTATTFRDSSYSAASTAHPPPSILSSSSDTPSSPRSTYAAPAPSSIFGMPLNAGTDPSRRERGKMRKPIPSFGGATAQSTDDNGDWDRWRTSSLSSGSYGTFRTAKMKDEDGRCSNGDPGGSIGSASSSGIGQGKATTTSVPTSTPSISFLPELSLGGALLDKALSLQSLSADAGPDQSKSIAGEDAAAPETLCDELPRPVNTRQTLAAETNMADNLDNVQPPIESKAATPCVQLPAEEKRSRIDTRSSHQRPFSDHRPLSPQSPSARRSSTLQKLPYNEMKQLLSKPSTPTGTTGPRVPSPCIPSDHPVFRPLRTTPPRDVARQPSETSPRTPSPSFTIAYLTPSDVDTTNGGDITPTPAEEIMLAYKRQTQRHSAIERSIEEAERLVGEMEREARNEAEAKLKAEVLRAAELEKGKKEMSMRKGDLNQLPRREASMPFTPTFPSASTDLNASSDEKVAKSHDTSPPTPSHAVFGSLGTVVAVGDGDDPDLQMSWSPPLGKGFVSGPGGKDSKGTRGHTSCVAVSKGKGHNLHGRPSLQEYSTSTKQTLVSTPSVNDDSSVFTAGQLVEIPPQKESIASSPLATTPTSVTVTGHGHSSSKSRIWNIMKRISTGALRDKYHRDVPDSPSDSPPPPVPALPEKLAKRMKSADRLASTPIDSPPRNLRSRRSVGTDRPGTGVESRGTMYSNSPTTTTESSLSMKTATRSSSPVSSSEVTSSQFFPVSRSSRSSVSSCKEDPPPLPSKVTLNSALSSPGLPRHILSPSELSKLQKSIESERDALTEYKRIPPRPSLSTSTTGPSSSSLESSSQSLFSHPHSRGQRSIDDWMIISTPAEEKPPFSLPVPPSKNRRREKAPQSEDLRSTSPAIPEFPTTILLNSTSRERADLSASPTIPEFSTSTPINSWSSKLHANSRSSPRLPARPSTAPTPPSPIRPSMKPDLAISSIPESTSATSSSLPGSKGRKSTSSIPTPAGRSMMIFRELPKTQSKRLPALTEQQKADKWDALLEKSAAAGGTLHIRPDVDQLESDNLRFSITDSEFGL